MWFDCLPFILKTFPSPSVERWQTRKCYLMCLQTFLWPIKTLNNLDFQNLICHVNKLLNERMHIHWACRYIMCDSFKIIKVLVTYIFHIFLYQLYKNCYYQYSLFEKSLKLIIIGYCSKHFEEISVKLLKHNACYFISETVDAGRK